MYVYIYILLYRCRSPSNDADMMCENEKHRHLPPKAVAKTAGPDRDLTGGLEAGECHHYLLCEAASRQERADLARFGLPFLQRWVTWASPD